MYAKKEKAKENKSVAVANSVTQNESYGRQGFGFVDNRSETIAQIKLQEMANNGPQAQKAVQLQAMANGMVLLKREPSQTSPNRENIVVQRRQSQQPIQFIRYEAGQGHLWHVHKDHVKYNGDNASRINFFGRSKTSIRKAMQQYHQTLPNSRNLNWTYVACDRWIRSNL